MIKNKKNINCSIIVPTYNRSSLVKRSIISALRQKNVSIEIVVIDDNSSDDTKKTIKSFKDKRIRYIKNKTTLGYALNVKKCFNNSKGDYIFTLGDDDFILDENTLFESLKLMKKHNAAIGKIGSISFYKDPKFPSRINDRRDKIVVIKPKKDNEREKLLDKDTIIKLQQFEISFYSGFIFNKSFVNKRKIINHILYPYFPLIFDAAMRSNIVFVPHYFVVGYVSYQMVPDYLNLDKHGSFFMDDLFEILRKFMDNDSFESYKKVYLKNSIINLPTMKYFSNNQDYIRILKKMIVLDRTLLTNPAFIALSIFGFMPKFIIKLTRDFIYCYLFEKKTINMVKKYKYFEKLKKLDLY